MSEVMLCLPQKSSISCVSLMPPMSEPREILPAKDQAADVDGKRFGRNTDLRERAVAFQQGEIGVDVVLRRHRVEDEMKTVGLLFHFVFIFGIDDFIRAEPQGILTLFADVVKTTTCAPKAFASFTPMWPSPPRPTTPTFWPLATL